MEIYSKLYNLYRLTHQTPISPNQIRVHIRQQFCVANQSTVKEPSLFDMLAHRMSNSEVCIQTKAPGNSSSILNLDLEVCSEEVLFPLV